MLSVKNRMQIKSSEVAGTKQYSVQSSFSSLFGSSFGAGAMSGNTSLFAPGDVNQMEGLIEPIVPEHPSYLARIYKDMYLYDTIAGSAVDLMSTLPFSDFTLVGADDKKLAVYEDCINRLQLKTIFPELSVDYMVNGAFIGSMIYKREEKIFTDMMPFDSGNCEIIPSPLYGVDPVIKLRVPKDLRDFLTSKEEHFVKVRERLSEKIINMFSSSIVALEPRSTLYIPRKTFTTSVGTSLYRRILPLYMLEKILYRGTYSEFTRRQRSILHVMCLTGDTLVSVDGKLTRIDKIHSHDSNDRVTKPVEFLTRGKDGALVKATRWLYQGEKSVFKVKTTSGYSIKGTDNHRMLVLDRNADLVWKEIKELSKGDMLCLDPNINSPKDKVLRLNLTPYQQSSGARLKGINLPKSMNADLAYFIGMLLSDGTIRDYTVRFAGTDKNNIVKIQKIVQKQFNIPTKIAKKPAGYKVVLGKTAYCKAQYVLDINSVELVDLLGQLGVSSNKELNPSSERRKISRKRVLPWSILQADRDSKLAFLAGYIDGDGSVSKNPKTGAIEISIRSSSYLMLKALQVMLLDMGIKNGLGFDSNYGGILVNRLDGTRLYSQLVHHLSVKSKIYSLTSTEILDRQAGVPTEGIIALINQRFVGQSNERRQYTFRDDNGEEVIVPYWGRLADQLFIGRYKQTLSYQAYSNGSYDDVLHAIKLFSTEIYNKVVNLLEIGYLYEAVSTIKPLAKKQRVYDLTIEKGQEPAFVANGFVVHNCGDEDWEPTSEELLMIVNQFQQADLDPVGAIVGTRNGVQTAEIRSGGDFIKYTDVIDTTTPMKLKALGISEAFLSGDATYTSLETSLSVFIEHERAYRDMLTRRIFTNKLFPTISVLHGFYTDAYEQGNKRRKDGYERKRLTSSTENVDHKLKDINKYLIPSVQWHKNLRPQADREYMDILNTLSEKGVPIPIAAWAAAGGLNIDTLLEEASSEKKMKETIRKLGFKLPGDEENGGMDGGDSYDMSEDSEDSIHPDNLTYKESFLDKQQAKVLSRMLRKVGGGIQRKRTLGDVLFNPALKENSAMSEVFERTRTGRRKAVLNQTRAKQKQLNKIGKAMDALRDEAVLRDRARKGEALGMVSPFKGVKF